MSIYMKYGDIKGKVQTLGYADWIELNSFQWNMERQARSPLIGVEEDLDGAIPQITGVSASKDMDVSSHKLVEALLGAENDTVVIAVTTTGKHEVTEFLRYTLTNTRLNQYSVASAGDRPTESLVLNFTKVEIKYTTLNPDLKGDPASTTYDLARARLNP